MSIFQSYYKHGVNNTQHDIDAYDKIRQKERDELQEINNRLAVYVKGVRDLSENRNYLTDSTVSLLNSMRYLENDLENLKQLYENEYKHLRMQIDTLNKEKNKLIIDNQSYDRNCRDLSTKYNEEVFANKKLANELLECKTKNNEMEYVLEKMRIEIDLPTRDLNQLQMDFSNLNSNYYDTKQRYELEMSTRQDLELKMNDLNEKFAFSKKIYEQEIESFKSQLNIAKSTISDLDTKLNDAQNSDSNLSSLFEKIRDKAERELEAFKIESNDLYQKNLNNLNEQIKAEKNTNEKLKKEIAKCDQRYYSLKSLCHNLETTIHCMETNRNILENDIDEQKAKAIRNLNEMELKLNSLQQLLISTYKTTNQPVVSFNIEIQVLKELLSEAEKIMQQMTYSNGTNVSLPDNNHLSLENNGNLTTNRDNSIEKSYQFNYASNDTTNNNENQPNHSGEPIFTTAPSLNAIVNAIGPITSRKSQSPRLKSQNSSFPLDDLTINQQSLFVQSLHNDKYKSSSSFSRSARGTPQMQQKTPGKDYTSELFSKYQKSKFEEKAARRYNSVEIPATDSSYIGNVKIHEVDKNGYYIRLLNVSNNCDEDISSYTIQQIVSSMPVAIYQFPDNLTLQSGHTVTVWARTDEVEQQAPHTFVCVDQTRWGTGLECTTILAKPNGQAVSWTTGCFKYAGFENNEIASVFTKPQNRARSAVHLIREQLNTHLTVATKACKPQQKSLNKLQARLATTQNHTASYDELNYGPKKKTKNGRQIKSAAIQRPDALLYKQQTLPLAVSYFKSGSKKEFTNEN